MSYLTDFKYYEGNEGSYQYVSLKDIVNNFRMMYTGNHQLINNVETNLILFHAKRAIQELNYDAVKEVKVLEMEITETLKLILPPDYVNWVRISMYKNGALLLLHENRQAISSQTYEMTDGKLFFTDEGSLVVHDYTVMNHDRLTGETRQVKIDEDEYPNYRVYSRGGRYGIDPETANTNPTFRIDKQSGVIDFSSDMSGELCVIEYLSDGMKQGNDELISVHKFFESYIYAYIHYEILKSRINVQEYIVQRAKKEKTALWRNARIRLMNTQLLMTIRTGTKPIK